MKYLSFLFVLALALSLTSVAFAQPSAPIVPGGSLTDANNIGSTGNVTNTDTLVGVIMGLVNWMAWFVGLMAVLTGLYAGILFITAGGNAETVTKARNILLYAIVGIAVAILAFSLVTISQSVFGI